ncbi:MAG: hypothetical protein P1U34_12590 [Coxiellaceae bacterium]|nr:hypothetical protein [Coxiellaceae bacterium]
MLGYKARHASWGVYIIVNTDTLDEDNKLILAEQRVQLEAAGVVVLDAAKLFSELGFYEGLEVYYRRALREGEGAIAHVMASDTARVAMAWYFILRGESVMYLDVDLDVASLDAAIRDCKLGVLIQCVETRGIYDINNNFFYINANSLGRIFLALLTDLVVASYQDRNREFGDQLFRPDDSMFFDYVLSLAGPQIFGRAMEVFADEYSWYSGDICGSTFSERWVLCEIRRLVGENKPSTWCDGTALEKRRTFRLDSTQAMARLIASMSQLAKAKLEERQEQKPALMHPLNGRGMFPALDDALREDSPNSEPPTCCERLKALLCCGR